MSSRYYLTTLFALDYVGRTHFKQKEAQAISSKSLDEEENLSKLLGNVMNNSFQYYCGECVNYYQIMAISDFASICHPWILSVLTSRVLCMVILKIMSFEYWPERLLILYWSSTSGGKNCLFGFTHGAQSVYLYILFLSLFV